MVTWERASATTRSREAHVPSWSWPDAATTMVALAPSRTMTPVSATWPSSALTETTMGSSRWTPRGTST